jgi:hypothetical protein
LYATATMLLFHLVNVAETRRMTHLELISRIYFTYCAWHQYTLVCSFAVLETLSLVCNSIVCFDYPEKQANISRLVVV